MGEKINTYVRPIITVALTAAFIYGFIVAAITADVFVPIASMVITWWFKSRDEQKKS